MSFNTIVPYFFPDPMLILTNEPENQTILADFFPEKLPFNCVFLHHFCVFLIVNCANR